MLPDVPIRMSHDRVPSVSVCDILVWNNACSKSSTVALSHMEAVFTPGHSSVKVVVSDESGHMGVGVGV